MEPLEKTINELEGVQMETKTTFQQVEQELLQELDAAEKADDQQRTQPMLDDEVAKVLESRHSLMVGMAQLSALTIKIDKLLHTIPARKHITLQVALKNLKRDLLVGLAQIQAGSK